jgi:lysophospholipase II
MAQVDRLAVESVGLLTQEACLTPYNHCAWQHLATHLPWCKFVLPTAPVNPVTLNGGMRMNSWYDIVGLDERSNEQCHGIDESRQRIVQMLRDEHEQTQLPYHRMVLAGFSQGGALNLYTGLQLESKLAGIVVLSGYLPHAKQFQITPGLENTHIFHGQYVQLDWRRFRVT